MTFKMSEQIIETSKFDKILCTRFAGTSDGVLSYKLRSEIAEKTHDMFGLVQEDTYFHDESTPGRIVWDNKDEELLITVFEQHHVFSPTSHPESLVSIATKDLAPSRFRNHC